MQLMYDFFNGSHPSICEALGKPQIYANPYENGTLDHSPRMGSISLIQSNLTIPQMTHLLPLWSCFFFLIFPSKPWKKLWDRADHEKIFGRWEFTERITEAVWHAGFNSFGLVLPKLVGGAITILKNDGVKVNGKDDIPFILWKINNVWNHQPGNVQQTMPMIFYCEPFYQLASLGRIRLAGRPEKIFQSPIRLHGDSTRSNADPKGNKNTARNRKKKTTATFDEMIQCIATSLKTQISWVDHHVPDKIGESDSCFFHPSSTPK